MIYHFISDVQFYWIELGIRSSENLTLYQGGNVRFMENRTKQLRHNFFLFFFCFVSDQRRHSNPSHLTL